MFTKTPVVFRLIATGIASAMMAARDSVKLAQCSVGQLPPMLSQGARSNGPGTKAAARKAAKARNQRRHRAACKRAHAH